MRPSVVSSPAVAVVCTRVCALAWLRVSMPSDDRGPLEIAVCSGGVGRALSGLRVPSEKGPTDCESLQSGVAADGGALRALTGVAAAPPTEGAIPAGPSRGTELAEEGEEVSSCRRRQEGGTAGGGAGRSLTEKKKCSRTSFPKKAPRALHVLNHGWWRLAVGGGWWWLAAVGGW